MVCTDAPFPNPRSQRADWCRPLGYACAFRRAPARVALATRPPSGVAPANRSPPVVCVYGRGSDPLADGCARRLAVPGPPPASRPGSAGQKICPRDLSSGFVIKICPQDLSSRFVPLDLSTAGAVWPSGFLSGRLVLLVPELRNHCLTASDGRPCSRTAPVMACPPLRVCDGRLSRGFAPRPGRRGAAFLFAVLAPSGRCLLISSCRFGGSLVQAARSVAITLLRCTHMRHVPWALNVSFVGLCAAWRDGLRVVLWRIEH